MIRMVLLATGFMAITIALVLFQPGSARRPPASYAEPVTRAEPGLPAATTQFEAHARISEPKTASSGASIAQKPVIAPVKGATESTALDDQSLRRMTWETLSNISRATGKESTPGQPGSVLHTIVRRSLDDSGKANGLTATQGRLDGEVALTQQQPSRVYVVQSGDSLVSIADKIYGDVNMTGPLFAANQAILLRPEDLRVGQILVLPGR